MKFVSKLKELVAPVFKITFSGDKVDRVTVGPVVVEEGEKVEKKPDHFDEDRAFENKDKLKGGL